MKHLTDGERDILREQEHDARPDAYEALQISYEDLTERYDTALDTIAELQARVSMLAIQLGRISMAAEMYEAIGSTGYKKQLLHECKKAGKQ